MIVVVVNGHGKIGPGQEDPGGQGAGGSEAEWVQDFTLNLTTQLRHDGHAAYAEMVGPSMDRSLDADVVQPDLIIYVHGDVGRGGVFYFPGSSKGHLYATSIFANFANLLPIRLEAASEDGYPRAYSLLARTKAVAVLLELCDQRNKTEVDFVKSHFDLISKAVSKALLPK